jgi:hypothetical protein
MVVLFAKEPKAFFWRKRSKTLGVASLRRDQKVANTGRCGTTLKGSTHFYIN